MDPTKKDQLVAWKPTGKPVESVKFNKGPFSKKMGRLLTVNLGSVNPKVGRMMTLQNFTVKFQGPNRFEITCFTKSDFAGDSEEAFPY